MTQTKSEHVPDDVERPAMETSDTASERQQQGSCHTDMGESRDKDTLFEIKRKYCESGVRGFVRSWKTAIRPWREFLRGSNFGLPMCPHGYPTQLRTNLAHFLPNYFAIMIVLMLCSIITSFWLLVSTIILIILFYLIRTKTAKGPIIVGNEQIPAWILYAAAVFITIPLFIFAHVGYIIYCAFGASVVLILLHASFYRLDRAQQDDVDVEAQTEIQEPTPIMATKTIITVSKVQFEDEIDDEISEKDSL